ncbi:hypothetical protein GCM10018781_28030 [Kitasatospora indigofera]|uniref:Uncharacterized protein n=1 Tax=Kitasatospora indigofera TaxID=67307 RepID=A0A919FNA5_9ACTN|nr:hypothetical protein GCM10018781_28030 [Kitasatospora indigofera]
MTATAGKPCGSGLRRTGTRVRPRDAVRSGDRPGPAGRGRAATARRRTRREARRLTTGRLTTGPFPVPARPAPGPGPGGAAGTVTGAAAPGPPPPAVPGSVLSSVPSTLIQSPCTVICQLRRNSHVREP